MTSGRDDDALRWEGDDDPTLGVGDRPVTAPVDAAADDEPVALPVGFTAVGRGSAEVGRIDADGTVVMPDDRPPLSNAMLVTLGVVAGIYLLYTIGWAVGGGRLQATAEALVIPAGYQLTRWLSVAAPALWFGTVFLLIRATKPWIRLLWLVAGLALLIPWPFIMPGMVGQ